MAGIPLSALRRALVEMGAGASAGVRSGYRIPHMDMGTAYGGLPGAIAGGALGAQYDDGNAMTNEGGAAVIGGAIGGAMLGAGGGGLAKLVSMGVRGAGGGAAGLSRALREALAEAAAERGMGRAAMREVEHADDAMRFGEASTGRRGIIGRIGEYIDENPEEAVIGAAAGGMGLIGGGGLLAIGGGMAAQYARAQQATGEQDLTDMTPEDLMILGDPRLGENSEIGEQLRQQAAEIMRRRREQSPSQ